MNIINDFNDDSFNGWYVFCAVFSLITFKKVKKIEQKKYSINKSSELNIHSPNNVSNSLIRIYPCVMYNMTFMIN
ncbi:hypothetical protein KDN24_08580 [Bacillus sp. Bva_UNVM-123]|uniref:hypothetical protein n=1 Tax=Bacillus sp. Bva_UNVM-123 TaxID=2829798 RepID=UPI00391F4A95